MPGLNPATVQPVAGGRGDSFDLAFVTDTEGRRWTVRCPRTQAAGLSLSQSASVLPALARSLELALPVPRGEAVIPEGRAVVYPYLEGQPLDFRAIPAGPGLAAEIGYTLARLHNLDVQILETGAVPVYDAEEVRTRRLVELDRAADTGLAPARLLEFWEHELERVAMWRFAATPIHGYFDGAHTLATFSADDDARSGTVTAVVGWDRLQVGDPASDFAFLVRDLSAAAFETVLEAYANTRRERPDPNLLERAHLAADWLLLDGLLVARAAGDERGVARYAALLRELDEEMFAVDESDDAEDAPVPDDAEDTKLAGLLRDSRVLEDAPEAVIQRAIDIAAADEAVVILAEGSVNSLADSTASAADDEAEDAEDTDDTDDAEDAEDTEDTDDTDAADTGDGADPEADIDGDADVDTEAGPGRRGHLHSVPIPIALDDLEETGAFDPFEFERDPDATSDSDSDSGSHSESEATGESASATDAPFATGAGAGAPTEPIDLESYARTASDTEAELDPDADGSIEDDPEGVIEDTHEGASHFVPVRPIDRPGQSGPSGR